MLAKVRKYEPKLTADFDGINRIYWIFLATEDTEDTEKGGGFGLFCILFGFILDFWVFCGIMRPK